MNSSRLVIILVLVALLSWTGYSLIRQKWEVEKESAIVSEAVNKLNTENKYIQANINYFEHPENLVKEAQSRFNYKKEGEKLMIVVPDTVSSATSTKK